MVVDTGGELREFSVTYTKDVHKKQRHAKRWLDGTLVLRGAAVSRTKAKLLDDDKELVAEVNVEPDIGEGSEVKSSSVEIEVGEENLISAEIAQYQPSEKKGRYEHSEDTPNIVYKVVYTKDVHKKQRHARKWLDGTLTLRDADNGLVYELYNDARSLENKGLVPPEQAIEEGTTFRDAKVEIDVLGVDDSDFMSAQQEKLLNSKHKAEIKAMVSQDNKFFKPPASRLSDPSDPTLLTACDLEGDSQAIDLPLDADTSHRTDEELLELLT